MDSGGRPSALLIHGAATTSGVWRNVVPALPGWSVSTPDRASTGDLAAEIGALAPLAPGAVVGGVSGGATLGLAMLTAGVPMSAAVLHEPAAGSLSPRLLDAAIAAWESGGMPAFGRALYGSAWTPAEAPADPTRVARDLAMFRSFEPMPWPRPSPSVLLTVGELSPAVRHESVAALSDLLGAQVEVIPGAGHAVHLEQPLAFARLIAARGHDGTPASTRELRRSGAESYLD
jgi:pimeloyl-ACP methyl ester carboxylesterase